MVGKELMHFCNARRTEVMWEYDCRRKKELNVDFSKNRNFRTPRLSVGFNELKQACLIFVKVMKMCAIIDSLLLVQNPAIKARKNTR